MTDSKRFWFILSLITLAGLIVRMGIVFDFMGHPYLQSPPDGTDMASYLNNANMILNQDWPDYFYYQPFYGFVFVPLVGLIAAAPEGVALSQVFIGTVCIILTGLIGRKIAGNATGWIGAALISFCSIHAFFTPFALMAVVLSFFVISSVWVTYQCLGKETLLWFILLGTVIGLSALTRMTTAPGGLFILIYLSIYQYKKHGAKTSILQISIVLVTIIIIMAPFAYINYQHFGEFSGVYVGSSANVTAINLPTAHPNAIRRSMAIMPDPTPSWGEVFTWVAYEPLAFIERLVHGFITFFSLPILAANLDLSLLQVSYFYQLTLSHRIILGASLAGLVYGTLFIKNRPNLFPIILIAWGYIGATVITYPQTRFLVPYTPVAAVLGAVIIRDSIINFNPSNVKKTKIYKVFFLILCLSFSFFGFASYKQIKPYIMSVARPHGVFRFYGQQARVHDYYPTQFDKKAYEKLSLPLTKTFCLPGQNKELLNLELAIYTKFKKDTPITLVVEYNKNKQIFNNVIANQWTTITLDKKAVLNNNRCIDFAFKTKTAGVNFYKTNRFHYGRTQKNNKIINGEAVVTLQFKNTNGDKWGF